MTHTKDEALRLADALEQATYLLSVERDNTAAELRRLHGENVRLKAAQQEPVCRMCNGTGEMDSGGTHPWGWAINIPCECTAPPAAQPEPVQGPLSFNCSAGCGACGVKLQDFVTHQTQAQEGDEWVVVATEPQIVSTCCGSPVEVWDERKQDITASVDATPPAAQPEPVQPAASLKEADVLMMAETHGIDPSTNGLYGFYIDCISNQPAAQPAPVPTSWMEMVTVNLLREGVNKHKARELAEHFYGLAPAQTAVPLTDEQIRATALSLRNDFTWEEFARAIEAAHGITKGQP
jgi:hypothetical protein